MLNPRALILCWIWWFWRHICIHVILNLNFYLFFPTTGNFWCGGLVLFGCGTNSSLVVMYFLRIIWIDARPLCRLVLSSCQCLLDLPIEMPLSKPLKDTMPKSDEEVQRLVEEKLGVCPCLWQIQVVRKILALSSCARQEVDPWKWNPLFGWMKDCISER